MRTRRGLLASLVAGTVGLAGCSGSGGDGERTPPPAIGTTRESTPTATPTPTPTPNVEDARAIAAAPLPENPTEFTYATMGPADAPLVTYFGNWKCPGCAAFSTGLAEGISLVEILREYVQTGDVRLQYRCLAYLDGRPVLGPDSPRAARAGLAVWNVDPADFWAYYALVMHNQPPESSQWATAENLTALAERSRVDPVNAVAAAIRDGSYESAVRATTEAARAANVVSIPMLAAGDRVAVPFDGKQARSAIEAVIE